MNLKEIEKRVIETIEEKELVELATALGKITAPSGHEQPMVFSFEKDQGSVARGGGIDNLAYVDRVVPAFIAVNHLTLDITDRPIEQRDSMTAFMPFYPGKFFDSLGGEAAGQLFLFFAEDIDRKNL